MRGRLNHIPGAVGEPGILAPQSAAFVAPSLPTVKKPKRLRRGGKVKGKEPHKRLDKRARGGKTPNFHPGGEKGKLHREMGIPEGQKIPEAKLDAAARSSDPEKRRDAIRAKTMKKWKHTGPKG